MLYRPSKTVLWLVVTLLAALAAGCSSDSSPDDSTTSPAVSETTTTAPEATTTSSPTTTTDATTTTTTPEIVFPVWRLPNHGEESAVVYVAYSPFGASDAMEKMELGHEQLDEIGQDLWEGFGSLGCDAGAETALGLDDGLALGVYFDTPAEAQAFAEAWLAYFGEPAIGVVDVVTTFCLD